MFIMLEEAGLHSIQRDSIRVPHRESEGRVAWVSLTGQGKVREDP